MTKSKMGKKAKHLVVKTKRGTSRPRKGKAGVHMGGLGLDAPAMSYANLLKNPRLAPLARPLYEGIGGMVFRATTVYTFSGNGTTETRGLFVCNPANVASGVFAGPSAADLITPGVGVAGPGGPFLTANATAFRPVAAMMEITYLSTELNRSGVLSCGVVPSSDVTGAPVTASSLSQYLPHTDRVDDNTHAIRWYPGSNDDQYTSLGGAPPTSGGNNALVVVLENMLPAAFSFRVEITCVYEYTVNRLLGVAPDPTAHHGSVNTVPHVVQALHKTGTWMKTIGDTGHAVFGAAKESANAIRGIAHGLHGLRGLGQFAKAAIRDVGRAAPLMLTM